MTGDVKKPVGKDYPGSLGTLVQDCAAAILMPEQFRHTLPNLPRKTDQQRELECGGQYSQMATNPRY